MMEVDAPIERLVASVGIAVWTFMICVNFSSITILYQRYSKKPQSKSSKQPKSLAPGITVLRPLKGVDCNLKENLATSFRQDYPNFELILSVESPDDPAVVVVRDLMREFPTVDACLILGDEKIGCNPKVNNLIKGYRKAKNDLIWVLDSNVAVDPGCMGRSVDVMMDPKVGLVHHLPVGIKPLSLGPQMERAFLNTFHAKMYTIINKMRLSSCVVGKSNIFRRSSMSHVGGLAPFAKFISEDNAIGQTIWKRGLRHVITSDVAYQPLGLGTLTDFFQRRARWTRIRKYAVLAATIAEPFTESVLNGVLAAYGFSHLFSGLISPGVFFAGHMCFFFLTDLLQASLLDPLIYDELGQFTLAWLLREFSALPIYLYGCAGNSIQWRGTLFKLLNDGTAYPLPSQNKVK